MGDMDTSRDMDDGRDENARDGHGVYLPGMPLGVGEELICDESAYKLLHQLHAGEPCLSFDIIPCERPLDAEDYPLTVSIITGTQASSAHANKIVLMDTWDLYGTRDSESENTGESDIAKRSNEPKISCRVVHHRGCVNRLRYTRLGISHLAATWSELGQVNIWDLSSIVEEGKTMVSGKTQYEIAPLQTFTGHKSEGFAIDWNTVSKGVLATGDCSSDIHIWRPTEAGKWNIDQRPLLGHTASVEDLQWSPDESNVIASCSVDKSIRIWDCRASPNNACMLTCSNAHSSDVNVISWNQKEPLIISGGDDRFVHVWDLRQFHPNKPLATFKHHRSYITTVEWHPSDSTVFASGGTDDQIVQWDLAIERDDLNYTTDKETSNDQTALNDLPPQLLFIHQGQQDIKELHWHPTLFGVLVSTAHSGFNIFRTISV